MYAFGFQFILMTLRVQLSGVTLDRFNPFRRTSILTWAVLSAHIAHVFLFGTSFMDESLMYLILSIMSFVSLLHFVVSVAGELRSILGINLLTMTKKQREVAKQKVLEASKVKGSH